jgi:RecA-family ATPase
LTMAMALAVADPNAEKYMSHNVAAHGRVLYFDEENPEDLIYDRMTRMGLTEAIARNIRYVNNVGVRLDKDPIGVLDEAMEYEPALIILDSLTRFHTEDENNNGAMASLFHNAFKPLARETGAAVVLIHHASKTDSTSGYRRARGAGDITASVDTAFDVKLLEVGMLAVTTYKSRRKAQGESFYMTLKDREDGSIELEGTFDVPVPF